jgi:uncharacterized protein with PIN domain
LIDAMFPAATSAQLRELGHDASHVRDRDLETRQDPELAETARRERRVLVTENVRDFAREDRLIVACVLKRRLRQRGMAESLAALLDGWARDNPEPYVGMHWPKQ